MRVQKYKFKLTDIERTELSKIINDSTCSKKQKTRAEILLEVGNLYYFPNECRPQETIASRCGVSTTTVYKVSKQYVEEGLHAAISRKKREKPPVAPSLSAEIESKIITLAKGTPPEGYKRWTLRLLEKTVTDLGIAEHISDTTIGRLLKKHQTA